MSQILNKDEKYIVTVDEDVLFGKNDDVEITISETFKKLIESMIHFLVEETENAPIKQLLFNKLDKIDKYFYAITFNGSDDLDFINKTIETDIKPSQPDALSFLLLTIDTSILSKDEASKALHKFFYDNFKSGTTISDLAMFDLTTSIRTRGYALNEWTEHTQG